MNNEILNILTVVLALLGGLVTLLALVEPLFNKDKVSARLKSVALKREELQKQQIERLAEQKTLRQKKSSQVSFMSNILDYLKLQNQNTTREIKEKLVQAGIRNQSAVITFMFIRIALPFSLVFFLMIILKISFFPKLLLLMLAGAIGFYIPGTLISNNIQKRQQELKRAFPDALDLLLICVEAGLSAEASFVRVSNDLIETSPALAEEIALTSAELSFLPERRTAYENLFKRTGLQAARSLATALVQSEKYGTPLATALRVVSQESRESRMSFAEKKAGSLPAKLTVPMILFFLPVLFIIILGPAIITAINQFLK
ncbi:MAG: type II secretion system F family protein [Alphaproteobacteria bacterium]